MKKKRDSGIELLRIICIILIIFHHYSYHGGFHFTVRDYGPAMIAIQEATMFGRTACSVSAFVLFSNLHFCSPVINEIAACVLGVYILHDNDLIRPLLWTRISPNLRYVKNPFIHMPVKVFCVFAVCVTIDILRRKCFGTRLETWVVKKLTEGKGD